MEEIKRAIEIINSAGFLVDEEAFDFLKTVKNESLISDIVNDSIKTAVNQNPKPLFLSKDLLKKIAEYKTSVKLNNRIQTSPQKSISPIAKEIEGSINILSDPTKEIGSKGDLDDFYNYFKDRFEKITNILRRRLDVRDSGNISEALKSKMNSKVKFIAIISDKRERGERIFFRVEDLDYSVSVLVLKTKNGCYEKAQKAILDQIACFEVIRREGDLFIAKDIIFPDLPDTKIEHKPIPFSVLLLSDIHFGSKTFQDEIFRKLVLWLKGELGSSKQIEKAGTVKYIIITGDIVDGIGVYPNQEDELLIPDIYRQYHEVVKYIDEIPDYIDIIIIPGNHDAVRQALPQPSISNDFAEPLYESRNIISLGNPSMVDINKRLFLLYHGTSLNDVISSTGLRIDNPEKAMEYLLKMRHLAPMYGRGTPLSPEGRDLLIIDQPPNVFQAGHIHVEGHCRYRGTLIVSCGAWQSQTQYQKKMGLDPTVGVASMVNLGDLGLDIVDFKYAF